MGGALGGYTTAKKEVIELLRQRSRPYLFSNTLPPVVAATTLEALRLIDEEPALRATLWENTAYFRGALQALGFDLVPGEHPIIPVMLGDAALAGRVAEALLDRGVYVVGFSYPVVPLGRARVRTQMSAGHTRGQLETAVTAFAGAGRELGLIPA